MILEESLSTYYAFPFFIIIIIIIILYFMFLTVRVFIHLLETLSRNEEGMEWNEAEKQSRMHTSYNL